MFDPQSLLGNLLGPVLTDSQGTSRGRRQSIFSGTDLGSKAALGLGALDIAPAADDSMDGGGRAASGTAADDSMDGGGRAASGTAADDSMDGGGRAASGTAAESRRSAQAAQRRSRHSQHCGNLPPFVGSAPAALDPTYGYGTRTAAAEHFGQSSSAQPPPPPGRVTTATPPPPPTKAGTALATNSGNDEAILLIRTMIAAAAADGAIDASEQARILARAGTIDAAAEDFLRTELAAPRSADEIAADTPPALSAAVYAAAWLSIDTDHSSERNFLDRLGAALGLDAASRQAIEQRTNAATPPPPPR